MAPSSLSALALALVATFLLPQVSAFNYSLVGLDWPIDRCRSGDLQSPINIVRDDTQRCRNSLSLDYQVNSKYTLVNNGHTVQIKPDPAATNMLTFNSKVYNLLQAHAHVYSEHTVDGFYGPFEYHFVHGSAENASQLLVLSTTYHLDPRDQNNSFVAQYVGNAPEAGTNVTVNEPIDFLSQIAPCKEKKKPWWLRESTTLYTYSGSLTTPNCDQGVTWLVIDPKQGPSLSISQVVDFQVLLSKASAGVPVNNRPPEPLNGRKVQCFSSQF